MKKLMSLLIICGLFVSCAPGKYIKVTDDFLIKPSDNETAWSRAQLYILRFRNPDMMYATNYVITSKTILGHNENLVYYTKLGIGRELDSGNYKYYLILDGFVDESYGGYEFVKADNGGIKAVDLGEKKFKQDLKAVRNYIINGEE